MCVSILVIQHIIWVKKTIWLRIFIWSLIIKIHFLNIVWKLVVLVLILPHFRNDCLGFLLLLLLMW